MRDLSSLLITLLFLFAGPAHAKRPPHILTRHEAIRMQTLLKRCDDGRGQDCYDYADMLRRLGSVRNRQQVEVFIHRACKLAYQPACKIPNRPAKAKFKTGARAPSCDPAATELATLQQIALPDGSAGQQITRLDHRSTFARAGLRLGDVVTKVNGHNLRSDAQLKDALKRGAAMIEIRRGRLSIPLAVACAPKT